MVVGSFSSPSSSCAGFQRRRLVQASVKASWWRFSAKIITVSQQCRQPLTCCGSSVQRLQFPSSWPIAAGSGQPGTVGKRGGLPVHHEPPACAALSRGRHVITPGEPLQPRPQLLTARRVDRAAPHLPGTGVQVVRCRLEERIRARCVGSRQSGAWSPGLAPGHTVEA